jgi:mRNA-degrading endonuclease RelE of RelBE toxin-antitoxin system
VFRPLIGALIEELKRDPKRHPKKRGELQGVRSAPLRFADGITWRAVYTVDEESRTVMIVSLGPHDLAYAEAKRRL